MIVAFAPVLHIDPYNIGCMVVVLVMGALVFGLRLCGVAWHGVVGSWRGRFICGR